MPPQTTLDVLYNQLLTQLSEKPNVGLADSDDPRAIINRLASEVYGVGLQFRDLSQHRDFSVDAHAMSIQAKGIANTLNWYIGPENEAEMIMKIYTHEHPTLQLLFDYGDLRAKEQIRQEREQRGGLPPAALR